MNQATMSESRAVRQSDGREAFTDYLRRRVRTENTPELQKLSVMLYRLLARGAPVTRAQLGIGCGLSIGRIEQLLLEFPATNLVFVSTGRSLHLEG